MYTGTVISNLEETAQKRLLEAIQPTTGEKEPLMRLYLQVPANVHDLVVETAKECGVSVSGFCRQAVTAYLEHLRAGTLL